MTIIIDTSYNKTRLGYGYGRRRFPQSIKSLLIHTTNGKKGTSFESERNYIYRSRDISAHYLCGRKYNQIAEILAPEYIAWHAGDVIDSRFSNLYSIGIENHCTVGESWTPALHRNLTNLCIHLLKRYPSIHFIDTHRRVAPTRKIDPSGFADSAFYVWSNTVLLFAGKKERQTYVVLKDTIVHQGPSTQFPKAGTLTAGDVFISIAAKQDEFDDLWVHLTEGDQAHLGFVQIQNLGLK